MTPSGQRVIVSPGDGSTVARVLNAKDGSFLYDFDKSLCFGLVFEPRTETLAYFGKNGMVQMLPIQDLFKDTPIAASSSAATRKPLPDTPYQKQQRSFKILEVKQAERYEEALELINEATRVVPNCAEYEFTQGIAFFRNDQYEAANRVLKGVQSKPWNVLGWDAPSTEVLDIYLHAVRAMSLNRLGQRTEAERQLKLAREELNALKKENLICTEIVEEAESELAGEAENVK